MLIIFFYTFVAITLAYILLMLYLSYGWLSLGDYTRTYTKNKTLVSILVAIRNEEEHIEQCLESLIKQDYPQDFFEILVINDHSTDASIEKVLSIQKKYPNALLHIFELGQSTGKKSALSHGMHHAKGNLIVTTDGDCTMNEDWLASLVGYYELYGVSAIAGPVTIDTSSSVFHQLQSLELMSMVASGASGITLGQPFLCNGANFAYEKQSYKDLGGIASHKQYTSGDDVFLLKNIKQVLNQRIGFIKHKDAIVYTQAQTTLKDFFHQRIRWVSKSKGYRDSMSILTASIIYLFNTLLLAGLIVGVFHPLLLKFVLFAWVVKLIIDLPLIGGMAYFLGQSRLLIWYLPLQLLYPFYTFIIGTVGQFLSFEWKGRSYRK